MNVFQFVLELDRSVFFHRWVIVAFHVVLASQTMNQNRSVVHPLFVGLHSMDAR